MKTARRDARVARRRASLRRASVDGPHPCPSPAKGKGGGNLSDFQYLPTTKLVLSRGQTSTQGTESVTSAATMTPLCARPVVDASPPEAPGALFTRLGNPQWVSVRFGAPWTLPNEGPSGGGALGRSPRALRRLPWPWEPTMQPVRGRGTGRAPRRRCGRGGATRASPGRPGRHGPRPQTSP